MLQAHHRRASDVLLSLGSMCVVGAGMAVISEDVRRQVLSYVAGDRLSELTTYAVPADRLARAAIKMIADYQAAHGSMLLFGVVAVVLVGFMLRS